MNAKQITRIVDSAEMRAMVKALKVLEAHGVKVEKTPTTRLLTIPNGRVAFRTALIHSDKGCIETR